MILTKTQQQYIESVIPNLCKRGNWSLVACAAGPDHVHVLLEIDSTVHGKQVRALLKRWLTQSVNERWKSNSRPRWWAEGGSNKPVKDTSYRDNAIGYIKRQRASED